MASRGRPFGSQIRQQIVEVLFFLKEGYGYEIHKLVTEAYSKCTREVVYYNLKRGVDRGEFKVKEVRVEQGNYSWGPEVRKIVYALAEGAKAEGDLAAKEVVENHLKNKNSN